MTSLAQFARISTDITGPAADDVDRVPRFPSETFDALRAEGLLSVPISPDFGGGGWSVIDTARAVNLISRYCSSTGLILAMHYSQLYVLARHGENDALRGLLRRAVDEQLLFANCNSEISVKGDQRSSKCFVEQKPDNRSRLVKDTPVISYGEYADALLITARRSEDADDNDQVLLACERAEYELTPTSEWDMLGLRGTCSRSFHLEAETGSDLVLTSPYDVIVNETGIGVTNVLFGGLWLGVGEAAAAVAHQSVRKTRSQDGSGEYASLRLAELGTSLQSVRDRTWSTAQRWTEVEGTEDAQSLETIVDLQGLKAMGTQAAVEIATQAMRICGVKSYLGGSPWSLGRVLRDAQGLGLMASADSALQQNAQMLRILKSI